MPSSAEFHGKVARSPSATARPTQQMGDDFNAATGSRVAIAVLVSDFEVRAKALDNSRCVSPGMTA
jgi:hypothetical protein